MQNGEVKLTAGYPEFLSSEPYTGYTDAVLICSDRVRLKASVTAMAAASKMLNSIFRQGTCCDGDTATEINVESTSDCVVKVLHFVHTGCLYTTTPYHPPADLVESFRTFGIHLSALKFSSQPEECVPDLRGYYLGGSDNPAVGRKTELKPEVRSVKAESDCEKVNYFSAFTSRNTYEPAIESDIVTTQGDEEAWTSPTSKKRPGHHKASSKRNHSSALHMLSSDALFYFPQEGEVDLTRPFQCDRCVRAFPREFDFRQHSLRHDRESNRENLYCLKCYDESGLRVSFEWEEEYVDHMRQCELSQQNLSKTHAKDNSYHNKVHSSENRQMYFHFPETRDKDISYEFKCQLCIRAFKYQFQLEQHLRRHAGFLTTQDEPFSCLKCNKKSFKRQVDCSSHKATCQEAPDELPDNLKEIYQQHNLSTSSQRQVKASKYTSKYTKYKSQEERQYNAKGLRVVGCEAFKDLYKEKYKFFYHFPQPGEKDLTKPFQCDKCVRKFEIEDDLLQHLRRHDNKDHPHLVYFCLHCDNTGFENEERYLDHMKDCDPAWEFRTIKEGSSNNEDQHKYYYHFPQTEEENISFPWKCKLCVRTFRHKKKFEQHLRRHVNSQTIDEAYSCTVCNKEVFQGWAAWKHHEKQCSGNDEPLPDHIWEVYDQHGLLLEQQQQVKAVMARCHPCGKIFSSNNKLADHLKRVGKWHSFCGSCDYRILDANEYQKHIATAHGGVVMLRCNKCGESCSNKVMLHAHLSNKHNLRNRAKNNEELTECICPTCGKRLRNRGNLNHHIKTLHGNKELKCNLCPEDNNRNLNRTFTSLAHLAQHKRKVHAKTYTCDLCGYTTRTSKRYNIHVLKEHTPNAERPFNCEYCNKGFFEKNLFKDHVNIHTGARPYVCKLCNASFNSQGNYGAHMRQTHKGIKRKK